MRKRTAFLLGTIIAAFSVIFGGIGLGSWIVENDTTKQYQKAPDANAKKVAYTQDSKGNNTYFTTIESALKHTSSGTVYVIPGTDPTISSNCEVFSGVTLSLPYEDDLKSTHTVEDSGRTTQGDFADKVEYSTKDKTDGTKKVFCKSNVTIADGVTLKNNGTIFVGGVLGRNGQAPTGMTVGNYSKITMGSSSKIENKGTVTCYGFIKEAEGVKTPAKVASTGSGTLNLPIVIYDYRGGSFSSYAVGALRFTSWKAMPFNVFDFPNVQCDVGFSGSSVLNGTITVYANDKVVTSSASIIGPSGSSSLIRLSSGEITYRTKAPLGYLYDDYQKGTVENKANITSFRVNGNVDIANMNIDVGVSIKTSEFHLPFSYKFAFDFQSGTINISNKVKFLAGSVVKISKRASVVVKAETVFYQNYVPVITTGRGDGYPRYTESAKLINNGTLTIQSSFGGIVSSALEGGVIKTASGYSSKVDTTEALTGEKGGITGTPDEHSESAKLTLIDKKVYDQNSDTAMLYEKSNGILNADDLAANKSLTSYKLNGIDEYGWYDGSNLSNATYGIRYVMNSDTAVYQNPIGSFNALDSSFSLGIPLNSNEKEGFDGFYYDSSFTAKLNEDSTGRPVFSPSTAVNYLNGNNYVSIYAKWEELTEAHYSVDIETWNTTDHKSQEKTDRNLDLIVGDSFTLDKLSDFYFYENLSVNGDTAKGTITRKTFDGYDVVVYDATGNASKSISIDSDGNSSDGIFNSFALSDTTIVGGNYRVDVKARYSTNSKNFSFSMTVGDTSVKWGNSTSASLSLSGTGVFEGMTVSYAWSASNNKAGISNITSASTTIKNNYSGPIAGSGVGTTVHIYCDLTIDSINIGRLTKDVEFRKGRLE